MIPRQDMKTGGNKQDINYGYFRVAEFTLLNTNHVYKTHTWEFPFLLKTKL